MSHSEMLWPTRRICLRDVSSIDCIEDIFFPKVTLSKNQVYPPKYESQNKKMRYDRIIKIPERLDLWCLCLCKCTYLVYSFDYKM